MTVKDPMVKRNSLYVTSLTTLDILQGITDYLIVRMEPIKEEMHLYVSYVITLDTHWDIVEWTKETSIGILTVEGTITRMTKGMNMAMITIRRK